MNNINYAFILTFIAGLSTTLGACIIFIIKNKTKSIIIGSLAFAAGVMITVSIIDLIPKSHQMLSKIYYPTPALLINIIFVIIGIIFSMLIDKYLPDEINNESNNLYRIGLITMIAIIMHNIPEGMASFVSSQNDISLGISITIAIALHNIPEGIAIAIPIYFATQNKTKAIIYTLISGLSEVVGAIITYIFINFFQNPIVLASIFSFIAGIMLHISFYELIPTSIKYKRVGITYIFILIGSLVMIINHIFVK